MYIISEHDGTLMSTIVSKLNADEMSHCCFFG